MIVSTLSFSIYSSHLKRSRENLINAVDIVDLDNSKVGQGEGGVQPAVRVHHPVRHPLDANVMVIVMTLKMNRMAAMMVIMTKTRCCPTP